MPGPPAPATQPKGTASGPLKIAAAGVSYNRAAASFPHGVLSTESLVPTVRKLPFLALALVALAILLLALGALPPRLAPHPTLAELVVDRRVELALGGLLLFGASIFTYLVV